MSSRPRFANTQPSVHDMGVKMRGISFHRIGPKMTNCPRPKRPRTGSHEVQIPVFPNVPVTQANVDHAVEKARNNGQFTIERIYNRTEESIKVKIVRTDEGIEVQTPSGYKRFKNEGENASIYEFIRQYFRRVLLGKPVHTESGTGHSCSRCRREHADDGERLTLYVCDGVDSQHPCPLDRNVCEACCRRLGLNVEVERFQCDFCTWMSFPIDARIQKREWLSQSTDQELLEYVRKHHSY